MRRMTTNHGLFIVNPVLSGSKNELFNNFRDSRKVTEILERIFGGFRGAPNLSDSCADSWFMRLACTELSGSFPTLAREEIKE